MILKSNYDEIDFSALYEAQKAKSSFGQKKACDWDKKAPSFNDSVISSEYVKDFISRVDFRGVTSLLDFACGVGALSFAAASKFKGEIYGYDFSPKMLEFAKENAAKFGVNNAKFQNKSFEDDWSDVPACDIVFASRCLESENLKEILQKLLSKTRKTLYITFKVGGFVSEEILNVIGREFVPKPDFVYIVNILFQMGYLPRLDYIKSLCSGGAAKYADELIKTPQWGLGCELGDDEISRLKDYFDSAKF
ncbi:MAG: class I SAM-dependent methyltransferase, partial [Campylobacter sp.]|nr:class I SAM-dependent methyltransferase [Campylobacter sp.]